MIHYNWHWFWHWGTGEACNNGNHEIDVCAGAWTSAYPVRVESAGRALPLQGRLGVADTQVASFEFEGNKSFIWEGRSCNGFRTEGLSRGVTFHGENGSVLIDDHSYTVFDQKMKVVKKVAGQVGTVHHRHHRPRRSAGPLPPGQLRRLHAVAEAPNANIGEAQPSVQLCHLANIAYRVGHTLRAIRRRPHPGRPQAQALWGRSYEKGWEPEGFKSAR